MHTGSSSPDDLKKKQHRRPWLVMGGIAVLLLVVLGGVFTFYDGPLPDDSDMMPLRSEHGGKDNPLGKLCADLQKVTPVPGLSSSRKKLSGRGTSRDPATETAMNHVSRELKSLESLLATDPATWQWPDRNGMQAREIFQYLERLHDKASLFNIKAELLMQDGKLNEAAHASLQCVILGSHLCLPEGETTHITIAREIMASGLESLRKVLTKGEATPELLAQCEAALAPLEGPGREQMAQALKVRYQQFRGAILQKELPRVNELPHEPDFEDKLITTFYLKPHRTLTRRLPMEREWQQLLKVGWTPTIQSITKFRNEVDNARGTRPWLRLLNPNGFGEQAAVYGAIESGTHINWALKRRCHLQQARIILALRRYELKKGRLPASLGELVPAHLAEIPIDEFSGEPMKWNATASVVYSVGSDLKDDNGHFFEDSNPARWKDVSSPYWWSEVAKTIERY